MGESDYKKLPNYVIDNLARIILTEIQSFYDSECGKEWYEQYVSENKSEVKPTKA